MLVTKIDYDENNMQVLFVTNTVTGEVATYHVQGALKKTDMENIFTHINMYQATLTDEESDAIFKIFKSVEDGLNLGFTTTETLLKLKDLVKKANKHWKFERFRLWFHENRGDLFFADTIQESFKADDDCKLSREKTYIQSEYVDLIATTFFIRAFMPLYLGFLLNLIKSDNKQTYYNVFKLFLGTEITNDNGPIERLREFVKITHSANVSSQYKEGMLIGLGLSEDDNVDYLCSIAIIDRLLTFDPYSSKANPITFIYSIVTKNGNHKTNETKDVKSKFTATSTAEDEYSKFEGYRKVTDLSIGDLAYIQHRLKGFRINLDGLEFDEDYYREELKSVGRHMEKSIEKTRLNLLGWMLKDEVNPRALLLTDARRLVEMLLMVKTVLMKTEHAYFGMFLGSTNVKGVSIINSNVSSSGTMPRRLVEELNDMFTYALYEGGMTTVTKEVSNNCTMIRNLTWLPHGQLDMRFVNSAGYLSAPNDIYERMVAFVRFVVERTRRN